MRKPTSKKFIEKQVKKPSKPKKGNLKISIVSVGATGTVSMWVGALGKYSISSGSSRVFSSLTPGTYVVYISTKSCCPYCKLEGGPMNAKVVAGKTAIVSYRLMPCPKWQVCCSPGDI